MERFQYDGRLKKYLREQPEGDELIFLELEINKHQKIIVEYSEKTDQEIKKEVESEYTDKQKTFPGYEDYLKQKIDWWKENRKTRIKESEYYIEDLKIHKKRMTADFKRVKESNSVLFNGKKLNLSERYTIANNLLEIDQKIRTLNIKDLEKYQLLAYILGCNKDNARDLMNGKYDSKDRDLTDFFKEIGLNK